MVLTSVDRFIAAVFSRSTSPTETTLEPMGATPLMLVPVTTMVSAMVSESGAPGCGVVAGSAPCANAAPLASDVAEMRAACEALQNLGFLFFIAYPSLSTDRSVADPCFG